MRRVVILLLIISAMAGCSNVYSHDEGYRMSLINYSFPVPKNSSEMKPEACTGEITKSSKYKLKNIGGENGETPQPDYLNEIKEWGWTPLDDKSGQSVRYFGKEDKTVCVVFHEHIIDVFEITSAENP